MSTIKTFYQCSPGVPPGVIIPYVSGYFTGSSNTGFTSLVPKLNTALIPDGWRICDGSAVNEPKSPIFNGGGRHLPNLTDGRFVMGSTRYGGVGEAVKHTHSIPGVALTVTTMPKHRHSVYWWWGPTAGSTRHTTIGTDHPCIHQRTARSAGGGRSHTHGTTNGVTMTPSYINAIYIMKVI